MVKTFEAAIALFENPAGNEASKIDYQFPFKGDPVLKFKSFLHTRNFGSTDIFELNNSTQKEIKEGSIRMMASAPIEGRASMANYLYFEFPHFTNADALANTFKQALSPSLFTLTLANPILACNPETFPRSGSTAVKALIQGKAFGKCADDTWLDLGYNMLLGTSGLGLLDGPNSIIAISSDIPEEQLSLIDWDTALPIVDYKTSPGYFILRADNPKERKLLATCIRSFIADIPKPRMFWKQESWNKWREQQLAGEL